jgi:peptide/nickel transport system substrate-binding protein
LSYFTKAQATTDPESVGYNDANWCNDEYDKLYDQQHTELDVAKRRVIVQKMLEIFYEEAPYAVIYKTDELQAFRSDLWENFVRQPDKTGPVLFTNSSPSYLELRVKGTGGGGSNNAGLYAGIGGAAVLIAGGSLWFRSRRKGSADLRE